MPWDAALVAKTDKARSQAEVRHWPSGAHITLREVGLAACGELAGRAISPQGSTLHGVTAAQARISSKKFSMAFHDRSSDSLLYLSAGRPRLSASGLVKLWTVPP
jgi:hypothetical protein